MSPRAIALLGMLATLFVLIGSLFGLLGAAVTLAIAICIAFWSFWSVTSDVLTRTGASPCRDVHVLAMAASLAERAAIPVPPIYEIADVQPNAFAVGPNPQAAVVILTSALSAELTEPELRAVIAHELAHIRNRDTLVGTIAITFVNAIASLALILGLVGLVMRKHGGAAIIFLALLAPIIALILRFAMARSTEYRADRDAAQLCGHPRHLVSALRKLDELSRSVQGGSAALQPTFASLYIVDPLPQSWFGTLFSAHPPLARRIARLEAMTNDFNAE